jgi:hypothetical protein
LNDTGFFTDTIGLTPEQIQILETTVNFGQIDGPVDLGAMNDTGIFQQLNFTQN